MKISKCIQKNILFKEMIKQNNIHALVSITVIVINNSNVVLIIIITIINNSIIHKNNTIASKKCENLDRNYIK